MPLDFGVYNALSAQPDIRAERDYQAQALQYAGQLASFKQQQVEQRVAAQNAVQQYLSQVDQYTNQFLPEDIKRIQGEEQGLRQSVIDKIKSFNNDADMFRMMGGDGVLTDYANKVQQLGSVKQGLLNKQAIADYTKDKLNPKPLVSRETAWDVNGKPETGTFEDNVKAFQQGQTNTLNYRGSYELPGDSLDPINYLKVKKNGEFVPQAFMYQQLAAHLGNDDAMDYMKKVLPIVKHPTQEGYTMFQFGDNSLQDQYLQARIDKMKSAGIDPKFLSERYYFNQKYGSPTSELSKPVNSAQVQWGDTPMTLDQYRQPTDDSKLKLKANGITPIMKSGNVIGYKAGDYTFVMPANGKTINFKDGDYTITGIDPHEYILRDANGKNIKMYYKATIQTPVSKIFNQPNLTTGYGVIPGASSYDDQLRAMGAKRSGRFTDNYDMPVLIDITNPGVQGVYDYDAKKDMQSKFLNPISSGDLIDEATDPFINADEQLSQEYQDAYQQ